MDHSCYAAVIRTWTRGKYAHVMCAANGPAVLWEMQHHRSANRATCVLVPVDAALFEVIVTYRHGPSGHPESFPSCETAGFFADDLARRLRRVGWVDFADGAVRS